MTFKEELVKIASKYDYEDLMEFFDEYFSRSGYKAVLDYFEDEFGYNPLDELHDIQLVEEYNYRGLGEQRNLTLNDFTMEEIDVYLRRQGLTIMDDEENDALYFEIMKKDPNEPKTDLEKIVCKILNIAR